MREVADYLNLHPQTIYNLVSRSQIPQIRIPGVGIRFKKAAIDAWLDKNTYKTANDLQVINRINSSLEDYDKNNLKGGTALAQKRRRWNYGYGTVFPRETKAGIVRWYIIFCDEKGKRKEKVVRNAKSRQDAVIALEHERQQAFLRQYQPEKAKAAITFKEFSKEYIENYAKPKKRSWVTDQSFLRAHLIPFFGDMELSEITPLHVNRYMVQRQKEGVKSSTINLELAIMRKILNVAIDWGYEVEVNPIKRKNFLPEEGGRRERVLTEEEEERLFQTSPDHLKPILICALATGMRKSEITSLKWESVNLEKGQIIVRAELSKSRQQRTIPINETLLPELKRLKRLNVGVSEFVFLYFDPHLKKMRQVGEIRFAFDKSVERAKIKDLTFHDLRHTAGSRMLANGVDAVTVKNILGHKHLQTTEIYLHSSTEQMKKAVETLSRTGKNTKGLMNILGMKNSVETVKPETSLFSIN